jgi:mono/diheme cytochrome c family protein
MICDLVRQAKMASGLLIAVLSALPASGHAQPLAGNPLIGRQTAITLCASCHKVIGEKRPGDPPSFLDIANMPSTTALSLKVFLRSSHKEMPNLIISNSDTDDLIAHVLSLKQSSTIRQ